VGEAATGAGRGVNVLLVEDEARVADFVTRGLKAMGWTVRHAPDGASALEAAAEGGHDAIVLDLMLPDIPGQEVCRLLRARRCFAPVLMLTALDATDERVEGLRAGADDYLGKPFDFDELIARLEALVRRATDFAGTEDARGGSMLEDGDLCIDLAAMSVTRGGEPVELTAREREILVLFLRRRGQVLSRERILNSVWGSQSDPLTNVVDVLVARLRRKLGPRGASIETVRGLGYRFRPDRA
jgi:DNA-binding response OmpR family regulator